MTAVAAPAVSTVGWKVTRTSRDNWHVINQHNGHHFEADSQADVLHSIDLYNVNAAEREKARLAAEEAAKNPQAGEFGTTIPGEAFEFVPVNASGRANAPTVTGAGTQPEPEEVDPNAGMVSLSRADLDALIARATSGNASGAEPEPKETASGVSRDDS